MPCDSSHMEPNQLEVELSKIYCINDELDGTCFNSSEWGGYHQDVYCRDITRELADKMTAGLCKRMQLVDVKELSLEAQIWWRDHKAADVARLRKEIEDKADAEVKAAAIAKLSPRERELLGLD